MLLLTRLGVTRSYARRHPAGAARDGARAWARHARPSISTATLGVDADATPGVASATGQHEPAGRRLDRHRAAEHARGDRGARLPRRAPAAPDRRCGDAAVHGYAVAFSWAAGIFAFGALASATLFRGRVRSAEPSADSDARIRYARPDDDAALGRLAALDSAAVPAGATARRRARRGAARRAVAHELRGDRGSIPANARARRAAARARRVAYGSGSDDRRPPACDCRLAPGRRRAPRGTPMRHQLPVPLVSRVDRDHAWTGIAWSSSAGASAACRPR